MVSAGTLSVDSGDALLVGKSVSVDSDTPLGFLVGRFKRCTAVSRDAPLAAVSGCPLFAVGVHSSFAACNCPARLFMGAAV